MYERNAIVLERYFYEIFSFKNGSNLRENYHNYRELFECYGTLCAAKEKENISQDEFNIASKEISKLQKTQEKLYNKGAKFEYSRYVIFNNIQETPENIEKHLNKVNDDVQKNSDELKELSEKFVQAVIDYNLKENNLKEATLEREKTQKEYDKAYEKAKKCYDEMTEEIIENAKSFINSDNKENRKELQEIFEDNGKNEKNQFDPDVISNTINKSIEIYKTEMDVYLAGYDRISKLFEEIETDSVKNDKHTKYYRDSKAKVDFLNAEKEYIVQFLDNERIGAIYDKKTHRKLMLEACKKFVLDFTQIDKLYDIILKEVAGRSTKKIYKENYNKEYLIELENSSVEPSLDTGKMRQEAIAFVNLNYWRVEGIRSVYNTFENVVIEIYEKDLSEFTPEEPEEEKVEEVAEEIDQEEIVEEIIPAVEETIVEEKVKPRKVYYSSKISLANAIYHSLQTREFAGSQEEVNEIVDENIADTEDEQYSVPENVKEILANVEEQEEIEEPEIIQESEEIIEDEEYIEVEEDEGISQTSDEANSFDLSKLDEIEESEETEENNESIETIQEAEIKEEDIEEDEEYIEDEELEEDSILEIYFKENSEEEKKKTTTETLKKKAGFFQKLVGLNGREKRKA